MKPSTTAWIQLVVAAVLWSLGSFFMRVLRDPTPLHLQTPQLDPVQIAFFRSLFGGLCLLPLVPWKLARWRIAYLPMVACFAAMTGLYLTALGLGVAANAILLQNTAPVWVYLIGICVLKQTPEASLWQPLALAMLGAVVIVLGNWPWHEGAATNQVPILLMALGSGVAYAGVIVFLSTLRAESPALLSVVNLLGSAAVLAAFVLVTTGRHSFTAWLTAPTLPQLLFLALFGAVQMALPYVLFATALKRVSTTEAALITLIEPLLNPVWAYLISPATDKPTAWTFLGGALLLAALLWRALRAKPRA